MARAVEVGTPTFRRLHYEERKTAGNRRRWIQGTENCRGSVAFLGKKQSHKVNVAALFAFYAKRFPLGNNFCRYLFSPFFQERQIFGFLSQLVGQHLRNLITNGIPSETFWAD